MEVWEAAGEIQLQLLNLKKCHKEIISDLDVQDVVPHLLARLVIDHRDKQLIDHEKTLEDKAEKLLNIIERKVLAQSNGCGDVIPAFYDALKVKYEWLFLRLTEDTPDSHGGANSTESITAGLVPRNKRIENIIQEELGAEPVKFQKAKYLVETGGVPCCPTIAVERTALLEQIQAELHNLKRNHYLVIQGMPGCGKSVLAIQSIRDLSLVDDVFPHGVFWLAVGKECSDSKDALLAKMRILCEKLGESRAPNSFEHGADILRTAFLKKPKALLILDDVWRSEVIRAFDVGCPTLVTTRDISIMDVIHGRFKHIPIEDGFTEEESIQLFQLALKSSNLPAEAAAIHSQCKGSPMVISLISSLLQDHPAMDQGRWQYYLKSLEKRKYSKMRRTREYEHENILDAISLSVENLTSKSKDLYGDFALFQDDVGIPYTVLMTLWSMQKYEVEDTMKVFIRKSLAVGDFDDQKKCFTYYIHDLLLDYLKYQLVSKDNGEKLAHSKLLQRYFSLCSEEFHNLPNDGYIYFYLGYHLRKSGMQDYFPKIYMDLRFIGEKLRITGPADLLVDIKKYYEFIVKDDQDEEKIKLIEEIQTFAQLVGHRVYGQLDVDIVQIALQTPHLTRIHKQAKTLAESSSSRLYIEWKNAKSGQWKLPEGTVLCSDHVHCVKFVGNKGSLFIAGLSNGCIQLCDLDSSAIIHVFTGHADSVNSVQLYPSSQSSSYGYSGLNGNGVDSDIKSKLIILSTSADKTCKIWDLREVLDEVESKSFDLKSGHLQNGSPSPKMRLDQWAFNTAKDNSILSFELHTASVSFAEFSFDGLKVVSTSSNEIMIWSSSIGQILSKISISFDAFPDLTFQRCKFPPEPAPSCLICSAENQVILLSSESSSLYSNVEGHAMRIVELLFVSRDYFCTVSEIEIGIWKIVRKASKSKASRSRSLSPSGCITMGKTQVDSLKMRRFSKTLHPSDISFSWKNEDSNSRSGSSKLKLPVSKSVDNRMISSTRTQIDDGNVLTQITKEDKLSNKGTGLYLCAAITRIDDGHLIACGTSDHKIVLWRLDRRELLGSFTSHNGWVTSLDFSSVDIYTVLSGSEDHTVMVWDIEDEEKGTKEPQKSIKFTSCFIEEFNNQGYFLNIFTTEKNTVQIFRDSRCLSETSPVDKDITCLCISDCGRYAAIGTSNGGVFKIPEQCFQRQEKQHLKVKFLTSLQSKITCLKFGYNPSILVAGSASGQLSVFVDFGLKWTVQISDSTILQAFLVFRNKAIVCTQDASVMMVRLDDKDKGSQQTWKFQERAFVTCCDMIFHSNNDIESNSSNILGLGTSDHGIILLNISEDMFVSLQRCLDSTITSPVRSLAFNQVASKLSVGHDNGLISVWCIEEGFKKEADLVLHKSWVRGVKFCTHRVGNAQWLISCGDKLAFWNLDKHEVKPRRSSFMVERRRRRSGESPARSNPNRLSLEIPDGSKIGRQGKRELLQQFTFRGNFAQSFFTDPTCDKIVTVDDTGVFYLLETLKSGVQSVISTNI